jgi:segregation and condensation protein B
MANRSKSGAGAGGPEGDGEGEYSSAEGDGSVEVPDVGEGGSGSDDDQGPSVFDDVPTRPGVAIDDVDEPTGPHWPDPPETGFEESNMEATDPGIDVAGFAESLEPSAVDEFAAPPRTRNDPMDSPMPKRKARRADRDVQAEPGAASADESVAEPTDAAPGGAQILDFSSGRADAGAAPDDDARAPTDGETGDDLDGETEPVPFEQLEPLIEALLLASDKPLSVADIKRLTGERDTRLINQALESLVERRRGGGIQIMMVAGAYSLRTNPQFADWVSKLVAGKPVRLSRALLETLAIVAYRQPITRPEIDDIRGVDCGPVLKTLLDRNLVRIIGKKEEVGRPMLYGTTSEFLRIFSLKDLTQLPTLRQFHELSAEHQAKVDENHPAAVDVTVGIIGGGAPIEALSPPAISPDPGEDDRLISELEEASEAASRAAGPLAPETPPEETDADPPGGAAVTAQAGDLDEPTPPGRSSRSTKSAKSARSE